MVRNFTITGVSSRLVAVALAAGFGRVAAGIGLLTTAVVAPRGWV